MITIIRTIVIIIPSSEWQAGTFNEHTAALLFKQIMPGPTAERHETFEIFEWLNRQRMAGQHDFTIYVTCVSAFPFRKCYPIYPDYSRHFGIAKFLALSRRNVCRFPLSPLKLLCRAPRSAVSYIHMNMICHRDLKPENFLISKKCAIQAGPTGLFRTLRTGLGR